MNKQRPRWIRHGVPAVLVLSVLGAACRAAEDPGLDIADTLSRSAPPPPSEDSSHRRVFVEATASAITQGSTSARAARASIDYFRQFALSPGLHGIVSGRLDYSWVSTQHDVGDSIHTLRELLVEWQGNPNWVVDSGRINAQFGEAIAFNPTDFFREGSLRNVTSVLPANLRDNRQGSVMLRAQRLWEGGAITMIASPRLPGRPSTDTFSLDFAATNPRDRWLVAISQKLGEQVAPQLVFAGGVGQSPQAGFSVSLLPWPGAVAYVEASVARRPTTLASIGAWADDSRLRPQAAVGGTWSATDVLSLNLEFDVDTTAPSAAQARTLATAPPAELEAFKVALLRQQTLAYLKQWFAAATWKDLLGPGANLSALARIDARSGRGQYWLEFRKRFGATELATQFLVEPRSAFGAHRAGAHEWSLVVDHHF